MTGCAVCGPAAIVFKAWIKGDEDTSQISLCSSCIETLLEPRCQRCGQPKDHTSKTHEIHVKSRTSVPICDDCRDALLADLPAGAEPKWDTRLRIGSIGWSE